MEFQTSLLLKKYLRSLITSGEMCVKNREFEHLLPGPLQPTAWVWNT